MTDVSVSYAAAFGGGLISFLSPCVLPLVPAYLSMITGLEVAEVKDGQVTHLRRIARDTGLFVAGFTVVFVLLGLSASAIGQSVVRNHLLLTRISGALVVAMALFLAGSLVLKLPWLYQERRFHPSTSRLGPFAAPVAGAAFGFGWTPCIGPILTSVLAVAASQSGIGRGAVLLGIYSLGLGVPFLATGLAFGRLAGAFAWVRSHFTQITVGSAVLLGFFGLLLFFNRLTWITTEVQTGLRAIGLGRLVTLG